jgi:hypothetical protein
MLVVGREQSMSRTGKYYLPNAIKRTELKLEALHLQQEIAEIDHKLEILKSCKSLYPPHKADDDEQPCALHTAALPDQE